jgi:hypothetical protein
MPFRPMFGGGNDTANVGLLYVRCTTSLHGTTAAVGHSFLSRLIYARLAMVYIKQVHV